MREEPKIDLFLLGRLWLGNARRCWALGLVLTALGAAVLGWQGGGETLYEAFVSVSAAAEVDGAERVLPSVFRSGILERRVCGYLNAESIPEVSLSVLEHSGVYTLRVRHPDGEWAWRILEAMVECAPEVAGYTLGDVELTILADSGIPRTPVENGGAVRWLLYGMGAGGAAWAVLVLIWTLLRQTIRTEAEPEPECLGVFQEESCVQRLSVKLRRLPEGRRRVLIAAALPGEGATALVEELAGDLSRRGCRVLVCDCDPQARTRWQIPEVCSLAGEEALSRSGGEKYDFILIDTPPCALTAQGARLSDLADVGLLVIRRDYAGRHRIREAVELLTGGGMELMGFVFNQA